MQKNRKPAINVVKPNKPSVKRSRKARRRLKMSKSGSRNAFNNARTVLSLCGGREAGGSHGV